VSQIRGSKSPIGRVPTVPEKRTEETAQTASGASRGAAQTKRREGRGQCGGSRGGKEGGFHKKGKGPRRNMEKGGAAVRAVDVSLANEKKETREKTSFKMGRISFSSDEERPKRTREAGRAGDLGPWP